MRLMSYRFFMPSIDYKSGILKALLIVAALFVVLAGLKIAANILVPFLLSLFIAIVCHPLVKKIERFKVPKPLAILGVVLVIVTCAVYLVGLVGRSLLEMSQLLPGYLEQLRGEITWVVDRLAEFNIVVSRDLITEYFNPGVRSEERRVGNECRCGWGAGGVMENGRGWVRRM